MKKVLFLMLLGGVILCSCSQEQIDLAKDDGITTLWSAVLNKGEAKDGSGVATRAGCCRQESSWGDCMTCTHGFMGFLGYVMMAYIPEFEVAVMGSCLGAGAGAWC